MLDAYETNADLEHLKTIYKGKSRDVAESLIVREFSKSEFKKDFVLYDTGTQLIVAQCFSQRTKRLRGEDLG